MTHDERMHELLYSNDGREEMCERICNLEQLVMDFANCLAHLDCPKNCKMFAICNVTNPNEWWFERRMRELGIEVEQ